MHPFLASVILRKLPVQFRPCRKHPFACLHSMQQCPCRLFSLMWKYGAVGSSAGLRRWRGEEEFVVTAMRQSAGIVGIVWDVEVVVMPAAAVRWTVGRIRLSRRGAHSSCWGFVGAAYVESSGLGWGCFFTCGAVVEGKFGVGCGRGLLWGW